MYRRRLLTLLILSLLLPASAPRAAERPLRHAGNAEVITGGNADFLQARRDTHLLMGPWGSGADYNGQFEDPAGGPARLNDPLDPSSWTSWDITQTTASAWHVDPYLALAGLYSAWCGEIAYHSCGESDPEGGYGNNYDEWLDWSATVADPGQPATLHLTALVSHDVEPAYDFASLECLKRSQDPQILWIADGRAEAFVLDCSAGYQSDDYLGAAGDGVRLRFRVTSDGAWSDADCMYPSAGACRVDDVTVTLIQAGSTTSDFTDFEGGDLGGRWAVALPPGVGDFAQIWSGLHDVDPCVENPTPQVAFIDDAVIVPGTGGSYCINWCYGPAGFIVNTTGGLAGPDHYIHNAVESPVMPWPDPSFDYCRLDFTLFRHEDLSPDAPGIFYTWGVRSVDSDDPADIRFESWADRSFVSYGGPDYLRSIQVVSDLLEPDRDFVQVQFTVYEVGWVWGWIGDDGYPAPYFDDVRVTAAPFVGPGMATRELDLANDGFPANGTLEPGDPGALSVRFDMARNISLSSHLRNDPGDSIVADIVALRPGAALVPGSVRLYYALDANPVFDAYRTSGLPSEGSVPGVPAAAHGTVTPDKWAFDLPDTGFLFPGDVLHYYLKAADEVAGEIQTATLPVDRTGFGDFSGPLTYDSSFTVRALPSLDETGDQPHVLFWNDFANRGGQDEWHTALANQGLRVGRDYDLYYTNGPSSGVGNGLGGRATTVQIAGYRDLLYTCGDLSWNTLSNGDYEIDAGDDVGLLDDWLRLGGKDLLLTGDDLAFDLAVNGGPSTLAFLETWLKLRLMADDVRPLIGGQAAPRVLAEPDNPVFQTVQDWIAYGGCLRLNSFDAVEVVDTGQRLARFRDPAGSPYAYTYSAASLNVDPAFAARVVSLPYDLMFVHDDPATATTLAARARLLGDVLNFFGVVRGLPAAAGVPAAAFTVHCRPNPFNPQTRIEYTLPAAGRLTLKIYDLRGALTRTLIDGHVPGSGFAVWDGRDDGGARAASGLYFYEARAAAALCTGKLILLK